MSVYILIRRGLCIVSLWWNAMPEYNIALFDKSGFILIDESNWVKIKRPCDVRTATCKLNKTVD